MKKKNLEFRFLFSLAAAFLEQSRRAFEGKRPEPRLGRGRRSPGTPGAKTAGI